MSEAMVVIAPWLHALRPCPFCHLFPMMGSRGIEHWAECSCTHMRAGSFEALQQMWNAPRPGEEVRP